MSDPPGAIRMSVIVPVHNRSSELRLLLEAMSRQALSPAEFEVLVCDDGSTEDLGAIVASSVQEHGLSIRLLRQEWAGPASARNLGLAQARGTIIASIDSDCVPEPGWLMAYRHAFDDPSVGLAGGPLGYRAARHLSGRCVGFLMASTFGAAGATDPRRGPSMEYHPCAGNMAVRRGLALAVGGFPDIPYNEDTEFAAAIGRLGVRASFVPEAAVLHDERSGLFRALRENFLKGTCRVRRARGFSPRRLIPALPAGLVLSLIALVASPWLGPALAPWISLPLAVYLVVLGILAIQAGMALGELRAALAVPVYALAMHLGYGCGYLAARFGLSCFLPKRWSHDDR